ncbi:hypothetical protein [Pedobacter cryoconitis]|uniref:Uncharacterized protein n=1 Tax=Pedobacter cryoconitis TaxID=188932 RepID=A0A327SZU6_9SPHI|nr:hypothetical protein [Pedobacter cryoconitis]RAJ34398.1 hypothetical protein LY11_01290 [Pedobacter cryoconitis]
MKSLFNISPFILLLAPVFVMMILTFTISADQTSEVVVKNTVATSPLAKASVPIAK